MTPLQLNDAESPERYEPFEGGTLIAMPRLIASGKVPVNTSDVMDRRLEVANASYWVETAWLDNYFQTIDGFGRYPNGKAKLVLDAQPLREVDAKSEMLNGYLVMPDDLLTRLEGEVFNQDEIEKYTRKWQTKTEVLDNPFLRVLARDQHRLKEYADYIFAMTKQQYGFGVNMAIYLPEPQVKPVLGLGSIDWMLSRSDLSGKNFMGMHTGRLVGKTRKKTLEGE